MYDAQVRFRVPTSRALFAAAVAAASAAAVACGPGFQAVYEGNARFEHCYGLEETPAATMRDKADCWRDWSDHYTYGQTRDRIQYAIARYVALSQAPNVPTDEALMMAAPGVTPRVSTITAPAPSNAFAPPPKVLEDDSGATGLGVAPPAMPANRLAPLPTAGEVIRAGSYHGTGERTGELDAGAAAKAPPPPPPKPAPPRPELPAATCADTCGETFRACGTTCGTKPDAGSSASAAECRACEVRYKKCMRGCFK